MVPAPTQAILVSLGVMDFMVTMSVLVFAGGQFTTTIEKTRIFYAEARNAAKSQDSHSE
jgi:hypothetical protein